MSNHDAIVIGAGHNGLACALRLQQAGKQVLVVEARGDIGGLCAPRELEGGYRIPGILPDTGHVRAALCDRLGLLRSEVKLNGAPPALLIPEPDGPGLVLDHGKGDIDAIGTRSAADARAYTELSGLIERVSPVLRDALNRRPPPLAPVQTSDWLDLGMRGLALRRLGRADMTELMRLLPMAVADLVKERFEDDLLRAGLAGEVLLGNWVGPWSAGTATNFLLGRASQDSSIQGGGARLVEACAKLFQAAGGEIRTHAEVAEILVDRETASGIRLVDGSTVKAPIIVSAASPRSTMLDLVPAGVLDMATEHEANVIRGRGTHAVVNFGLSKALTFAGHEGRRFEHIRIGTHLDELERAYDASKYGQLPERPALDVRIPSVSDPSLAPEGHDVVTVIVTSATAEIEDGWSDKTRHTLLSRTLAMIDEVAPGTSAQLTASEVLAPPDIEEGFSLPGGNLHHVEASLDQLLFLRPSRKLSGYRTPLHGLWLCGAGSHPGGGLTLAPGALAAKAILATG